MRGDIMGILTFEDGLVYEGEILDSKYHGKGKMISLWENENEAE